MNTSSKPEPRGLSEDTFSNEYADDDQLWTIRFEKKMLFFKDTTQLIAVMSESDAIQLMRLCEHEYSDSAQHLSAISWTKAQLDTIAFTFGKDLVVYRPVDVIAEFNNRGLVL